VLGLDVAAQAPAAAGYGHARSKVVIRAKLIRWRRKAWLAAAQCQDDQDDDHNNNDGSDAYIHWLSFPVSYARLSVLTLTAQPSPA
jgi:hypothetical protein